jgi:hypothetical protein
MGLIWMGWTVVGATVLGTIVFGVASGFSAMDRTFVAVGIPAGISTPLAAGLMIGGGTALGLGLGTPLVVAGQVLLIGLAQRRLLAEQGRTLRRLRRDLAAARTPSQPVRDRAVGALLNRLTPR